MGPDSKWASVESWTGPAPTHALSGRRGVRGGDAIELRHPNGAARDRAAHGDAAGLVEHECVRACRLVARRMAELLPAEAANALEPIPKEGANPHLVVVEPHLPVGHDVEAGALLIVDDRVHRVVEGLGVGGELERLEHVAALELMAKPRGPRVRADHRGREQRQLHRAKASHENAVHVPSPDMEPGRPSQTALLIAGYRARATARPDPVCSDPWAQMLAGAEGARLTSEYDAMYPHMELWTAVRTAYIDARVRRAMALGARQIAVLGAGFDTRAGRLAAPGVRFFEVDRVETQREKLTRLRASAPAYPIEAATYVECDFEGQDFVTELARAGFEEREPAFVVWEGVTPYLSEEAVRATLRRVATGLAAESAIVFDHLQRKIVAGELKEEKSRDFVGDLGEPLRFGIDDVLPLLYEEGFRHVRSLNFDEACLEHTGTYDRARKFRFQGLAVASPAARELP